MPVSSRKLGPDDTVCVEPFELQNRSLYDLLAVGLAFDVAGDRQGALACLPDPLRRLLGVTVFRQVRDNDVRTFASKRDGDRPANARVPTGDQGDLSAVCAAVAVRWPRKGVAGGVPDKGIALDAATWGTRRP